MPSLSLPLDQAERAQLRDGRREPHVLDDAHDAFDVLVGKGGLLGQALFDAVRTTMPAASSSRRSSAPPMRLPPRCG